MFGVLLIALVASATAKSPTFEFPFEIVTSKAGSYKTLDCNAEGEEPIKYRWYNERQDEITTRDEEQPVYVLSSLFWSTSSLRFKNLSSEHEGAYTCTASNAHGLASKVYLLRVSTPIAKNPTFRLPFEIVTRKAGGSVLLVCSAEGETPITYRWYNEREDEITTRDDKQPVSVFNFNSTTSSLRFKNLSSEHEGTYTCNASNAHGLASKVYSLRVSTPIAKKPTFRHLFEIVTRKAGGSVLLVCSAEGEEPITYRWYNEREDEIRTRDDKQPIYVFNFNSTSSSLRSNNVSSEQEGTYTCTASNAHGLASMVYLLRISTLIGLKPEFDSPHRNVSLESGVENSLSCRARGEKPITYNWYNKDGDEIPRGSGDGEEAIYIIDTTFRSDLFFNPLSREHEGSYTCTASNAFGEASQEVFLTVVPPRKYSDKDYADETPQLKGTADV